jgi:hypothetical protein
VEPVETRREVVQKPTTDAGAELTSDHAPPPEKSNEVVEEPTNAGGDDELTKCDWESPRDVRRDVPMKPVPKANVSLASDHAGPFRLGMVLDDICPRGYSFPVEERATPYCGGLSPVPTTEVLAHRGGTHETLRLLLTADEKRIAVIQFERPNEMRTAEGVGVHDTARSVAKAYGKPAKELPRAFAVGPFCATFSSHKGLGFCFDAKGWEDALSKNAPVMSICVLGG